MGTNWRPWSALKFNSAVTINKRKSKGFFILSEIFVLALTTTLCCPKSCIWDGPSSICRSRFTASFVAAVTVQSWILRAWRYLSNASGAIIDVTGMYSLYENDHFVTFIHRNAHNAQIQDGGRRRRRSARETRDHCHAQSNSDGRLMRIRALCMGHGLCDKIGVRWTRR